MRSVPSRLSERVTLARSPVGVIGGNGAGRKPALAAIARTARSGDRERRPCFRDRVGWDSIFGRDDKALSLTANELSQRRLADAVAISRRGIEMQEPEFGCGCKQTLPFAFAEIVKTRGAESKPRRGYSGFFEFELSVSLG